ncbi:helix-turn-helix transcriptional regulator [Halorarum halophilum]|uniref:Helix-turn-helix transcriptional regulator n=1 Tax=Halorarum halophilum TaxID=2743090 RepID=A0A7D5GJK8_9EURY|nr:helix-turn-helix domain-containing protein [Halobaculum halophilum]QLG26667.1 helix-turn-helix transcriptional regulator [Halobaculum halophilum]
MSDDSGGTTWQRRLDDLHGTLSGKWALHVLRGLADGPVGFGDLRERVGGAPEKSLARRLRELRCRGLLVREYEPASPPMARYRLTEEGERLVDLLRGVESEVEYVDCESCADDCRVATVNPDATRTAMAEEC